MTDERQEDQMIERLIQWAKRQPLVRAMLLTSSRAVPNAPCDVLSDYDVILALLDVQSFHADRTWLADFGPVLALYRDPLEPYRGFPASGNVTQYENGLKIDFRLWPVELLQSVVSDPHLPEEFDAGYRVLLDKDHLTDGLQPPTYAAYIPKPPTENEYHAAVEVFLLDATYVAKFLWRDDIMAAKHILDHCIKQEHLLPMLEWCVEIDHGWSVKAGLYGQRLKRWLDPDLWRQLETTYTGPGLKANWDAMFRSVALFRAAAVKVGDHLGYGYPHELERRAVAYLHKVKNLDPEAVSFC